MQLGYIGLGKMGNNMVTRLLKHGHRVVVYDVNTRAVAATVRKGARGAPSLEILVDNLQSARLIWLMVPYHFVDSVLTNIVPLLKRGDIIIDGGNSPFKDSIRRGKQLHKRGIHFLDVGVSGGPNGALNGACMMVGGDKAVYHALKPLLKDLCVPEGYGYMGASGAGHFVKMVHNGIEYGMMQAIAEGFAIMRALKKFNLDPKEVARVYNHGSVIESSLMRWMHAGFKKFGTELTQVSGSATGFGEGKWTSTIAHELNIPDHVIHEAVRARKRSKTRANYQGKIIMTLRNQFGGHPVKPEKKKFGTKEVL